eukprot:jgi/Orpsp1_1/1179720/evm.model.c7180000070514.1
MKKLYILLSCFIITKPIWTRNILLDNNNNNNTKKPKHIYTDYIEECKYINPLIGKDDDFNCCKYKGIYCNDEKHIIQ